MKQEAQYEGKIRVRQTRSACQRTPRTKSTLAALGLGRIGKEKELVFNPAVAGMVKKVRHLLSVEKV
jgi:large subunit ribosomal protein L30